jgi:hypothetical protein
VAAVITLIQSGFGPATTSGASQPAAHTSQPEPSAGLITFYLALPAHASSLVNDALAAAMPNNAHYRHFSSVATLAAKYGASNGTMQRVSGDIEKFGLSAAIDPSRLFARVSGTAEEWASALKAPLREELATPKNPYETYSLPAELPSGLPPSGTSWLFTETTVYDPSVDGQQLPTGLSRANDAGAAVGQAAEPWRRTQAR